MPLDRYRQANRAMWDESVPIHLDSPGYAVADFLAGRSALHQRDVDELGDVAGRTLLHLQCHFGLDTLSWARLGARVTGVDFSPAAIDAARDLARRAGLDATFVLSELYDAPRAVPGRFDVVYTGIGALCWLPDVAAWARVVAHFVNPGGRFYIVEAHPMLWTLDDERTDHQLVVRYPYFERPRPNRFDDGADYADPNAALTNTVTYEWNHGLGEIVTALIDAGLAIDWVHEHKTLYWKALPWMESVSGAGAWEIRDEWRLPPERADDCPLMYSLLAHKPA